MKQMVKSLPIVCFLIFFAAVAGANISLPEIFADNMVLQRNSEVTFWGWAKTGEPVAITTSWNNAEASTKADNQGNWKLVVKTPEAGGPFTIQIKGFNTIIYKNVMIGEVWLCSGQSNMEWSASSGITNKDEEIAKANYPNIRFFSVYNSTATSPQNHCDGAWTECSPETMKSFSAIAYFFGQKLNGELGIPIGLINSSWGGTPAEAWMPEEVIQKDDFLREAAAKQKPVPWGPVETARLYNAMIAPLVPFRIAGVLWYQGEGNTINSYAYKELLSSLIIGWRKAWNNEFPFYFAQIAPYKYGDNFMGVEVRDEQRQVLELENTGMVILSDIGDTLDIHPKNKKDAGLRFANMALNRHYKAIDVEDSGPLFQSVSYENKKAVVIFSHAKGLDAEGKITCFEIAGADKIYYPAKATIKNEQVVVESEKVNNPVSVRFAWRNTATPNLMNGAYLPASSFLAE
jgi:sialate O-acetylesterase